MVKLSKRQNRTGFIATARESLCHDRSVYNTLVLILKSQDSDIIAHAKKNVVVLGFYVSPTPKVIRRRDLRLKVSSERLEKPGIELTTP